MEFFLRHVSLNNVYMKIEIFAQKWIYSFKLAVSFPFLKSVRDRSVLNQRAERYMAVYGNAILRLAYSYIYSMEDAEDILQETLIRVLEANPKFANNIHEKVYVLRTASNISKNRIDYNKRRETDELNNELIAEGYKDLSYTWEAVKSLPITYRDVIHLFYYEGYKVSDISKILCRKESTIRSDLKRARERLKVLLKEEYDFE